MKEFFKGVAISFLLGASTMVLIGASVSFDHFTDSVIRVESKGKRNAIGDQGRSRGLAEISRPYYADACKQLKKHGIVPPPYLVAVRDRHWVKQLMHAYMEKYCPKALAAGDLETMARIHNGGLHGLSYPSTKRYAKLVLEDFTIN